MKKLVGLRSSLRLRYFPAVLLLFALILWSPRQSFSQVSSASVNGVVRDTGGAVIPNATVLLRNVDTSVENTTVTNSAGAYVFLSLLPGRYTVEATAPGFAGKKISVFTLTVGQTSTMNFTLAVGNQGSVVTVQATAPLLDVTSANLGTVIATKQVNDLPLNGRNFTQLLSLTPGVSPVSTGQNAGMGGGGFSAPVAIGSDFSFPSVNGQGNRSNFFLADGLDDFGSFLSTYAVPPIIDAIQEFKVVSHTDNAQYGSVLGGVVNVVTKSGTNAFHGSAWEYARDQIFDARFYFLPKTQPKTPFHQNQFGGAIGGPVWIPKLYNGKDKTFFFFAYQGFRYYQVEDNNLLVPTAAQLAGDESGGPGGSAPIYNPFTTRPDPAHPGEYIRDPFPNNQIPAALIDPRMVAYAKFVFPQAVAPFGPNGEYNAIDTTPLTQTENEWNIRVDQKVGKNDSVWFRYSSISDLVTDSGGLPSVAGSNSVPAEDWGGSYTHVFSPSLILQGQFAHALVSSDSATRFKTSTSGIFNTVGFAPSFAGNFTAAAGGDLVPSPGIANYSNGGESVNNTIHATDSFQYAGTLTKVVKSHQLMFGGNYISSNFVSPISSANLGFAAQQTANPEQSSKAPPTGNPMASFLLNVPDNAGRRNVDETTRPGGVMSWFAQDTWKATSKLTLNLGIRYDLTFIPPYGTNATIGKEGGIETGDMDFANGTYIVQKLPPSCAVRGFAPCIPGDGKLPAHVVVDPRGKIAHNTYNNWGPRIGFAYSVNDKTVVNGAFGIVYDNWAAVTQTAQNIEGSWPDIGQQLANNLNQPTTTSAVPVVKAQNPFATTGLFPAPTPFNQVQWFYDPHNKDPYSDQWNFGVARQLSQSTAVTLNYVGSVTHRFDVGGYYNTALTPGPGNPQARALYPYIAPTFYDHTYNPIGGPAQTASYEAFQFSLDKRYVNGLSYQVAYTWSKTIDEGGDGYFGAEGGVPTDPYHPDQYGSRSVAGFDLPQILSINTLYQVPVGKGQRFSTGNSVSDYLLGNWQFNGVFQAHSGLPFTPIISSDIANTGNVGWAGYEHANLVGDPNKIAHRTPKEWFNTAAYAAPPAFTYGTAPRNSLRTAPYWDLDASLFRLFPVGQTRYFEFRGEVFNVFNNVDFGIPGNDLNNPTTFGVVGTTANTARQIQLALKFIY